MRGTEGGAPLRGRGGRQGIELRRVEPRVLVRGNARARGGRSQIAITIAAVGLLALASAWYRPRTPSPSAATSEFPNVAATAQADGIAMQIFTASDGSSLRVHIHSDRSESVVYPVDACGNAVSLTAEIPVPATILGRNWAGIEGRFKDYALATGYGPGAVNALDPVIVPIAGPDCAMDGSQADLVSGGEIDMVANWTPTYVIGLPVDVPTVSVHASFRFDPYGQPPSYAPDYDGARSSWIVRYHSVKATAEVKVQQPGRPVISAGQALDVVLSDPKFDAWLENEPSDTWSNANLFMEHASAPTVVVPDGASWQIELFRDVGVPRTWAAAFVDPYTATLRKLEVCDEPCDR